MRAFIDMDGTLTVFQPAKTMEDLYAPGYFANLQPQMQVVEAVKILLKEPHVEVFILSAVFADCPGAVVDKNQWLDKYLPEIDRNHRVFASVSTSKTAAVPGGIHPGDVLLDDYTRNLLSWRKQEGAVGVKLLNGINNTHGTWDGMRVHKNEGSVIIAKMLLKAGKTWIES